MLVWAAKADSFISSSMRFRSSSTLTSQPVYSTNRCRPRVFNSLTSSRLSRWSEQRRFKYHTRGGLQQEIEPHFQLRGRAEARRSSLGAPSGGAERASRGVARRAL